MSGNSPKDSGRVALPHTSQPVSRQGRALGKTPPQRMLKVSVIVRRKQPLALEKMEGRPLSRKEFADRYSADPQSFDQMRAFAAQHGLSVDETASSLERRTIVLEGTVEAMEKAFGVALNDYERDGQRFHSYTGTITVPQEHSGVIEAVLGLDDRPIAKPHFRKRGSGSAITARATSASYTPPQVAQVYSFPTDVTGAGETVAILEFGGGFSTADLKTYFQQLGIQAPSVTAVSVDGAANSPGDPADGEVMLDIEVVGSVASGAKIVVYFGPNTEQGFVDAVTTAVHDSTNNPSILSLSWGAAEDAWSQQTITALDNAFQSAVALGVSVTVASGDDGSSDGGSDGGNHVDFPASSPHVLACGGTALVAQNGQRQKETVWNDLAAGGGASGGGVSAVFPLPSWQTGAKIPAAPTGSAGGRGVPDVAGNASPEDGYQVRVDGKQEVIGGTSAVAPLWAGLLALINQKRGSGAGFVNQTLYQSGAADFYDITSGDNGAFRAGKGWDACTGLGSPAGNLLETLLAR